MAQTSTTKFHAFTRSDTTYTSFDNEKIGVSVFVPKDLNGKTELPVHVRWHGGALINGFRVHEPWFPKWIIDFAAMHHAILITPDYRLLPESPGTSILQDLQFFYHWLHNNLPSYISSIHPTLTPNLRSILVSGESAGGYMALQSSLLAPLPGLKAIIAHYPMLDLESPFFSTPGKKNVWNQPSPQYPEGWLDGELEKAKRSHAIVTQRIPKEEDLDLFVALLEAGRFTQVLGEDERLFPLRNLSVLRESGRGLTPTWVLHGSADTVVPIDGTWRFVEEVKRVFGEEGAKSVNVTVVEGEEHGFDNEGSSVDDDWVIEGRKWVGQFWP